MEFKHKYELVDYLQENFNDKNFINNHTRPQLALILRRLCKHETEQRPDNAFSSMCKKRQCQHIKFWLSIHGYIK